MVRSDIPAYFAALFIFDHPDILSHLVNLTKKTSIP